MTDIHSNRFWRNVITKLKKEETDMTEHEAMEKMEAAIASITTTPAVTATTSAVTAGAPSSAIRVAPPGLDAGRLLELARDKLAYARERLSEIKREHTMKMFEINAQYDRRLEEARREREHAIVDLESQTTSRAKPARDMIDLVEKLLG